MYCKWLVASVLAVFSMASLAADDVQKTITDALHTIAPTAKVDSISKSDLPGFYQAIIDGHVVYVSGDGRFLVQGSVIDIPAHQDLTERSMAGIRKQTLAQIPADKALVFSPPDPKYTVTVFTDVDCPYCREFHKQIAEYNKRGIAVHYILFPLSIHPGSDKHAESVWCAKDRNGSYTAAMNGQMPAVATCSNPVAELNHLGLSMGVEGTPAIFTADGQQVGGYLPPDQLLKRLEESAHRNKSVPAS